MVVVASLSDAISCLGLPDWTELRNSEAVLSLSSLSYSFAFSVCLETLPEALFQIGNHREGRQSDSNFPSHIKLQEAGPSLSFTFNRSRMQDESPR